jgi:HTH-like domain
MLLRVPRSSKRPETEKVPAYAVVDEFLAERIRRLIELHPTYRYRLLWAMLRKDGVRANRKAVRSLMPTPRKSASRTSWRGIRHRHE